MKGRRLAHFTLLEPLGAGGMGEVWAAEDDKLGRRVAIKLLPAAFTADPERLARFEREARLLAALNHPAIAAIHSFESATATGDEGPSAPDETLVAGSPLHFLVMELVEGESLQQRLHRGAVALEEALGIARQLCEGLAAAHAQGIVHRDLKPGNVMLDRRGKVKVLDFGLAKALAPADPGSESRDLSASPTLTAGMTVAGTILGTAGYMSPEQATGKPVDKRADIWAFGVILWEMLTGRVLFSSDSVADTVANVLRGDIDLEALPAGTPPPLRDLLRRCLQRDPDRRLHDIADARLVIEDVEAGRFTPSADAAPRRLSLGALAAAVAGGALVGALVMQWVDRGPAPPPEPTLRFELPIADGSAATPALSPDGTRVAYASEGQLWVQDLDRLEPAIVAGGEGAQAPFWSPDGEALGFFADLAIWRVPASGGPRTLLAEVPPGSMNTGVWLPGERILFTTGASAVLEVSARGGDVRTAVDLLPGEVDFHGLARFGDGGELLVAVHHAERDDYGNATVLSGDGRTVLADLSGEGVFDPVWSELGWVLFERHGSRAQRGVWAVRAALDPPRPLGEAVLVAPAGRHPTAVGSTLVYAPTPEAYRNQLVWVDRGGRVVERIGEPRVGLLPTLVLSPNGARAVVAVGERLGSSFYAVDLDSGRFQRVTFDAGNTMSRPAFGPDGDELFYSLLGPDFELSVRRKSADASTAVETVNDGTMDLALSPDGRFLLYSRSETGFRQDLWIRDLESGDESPLSTTPDWDQQPAFSPDGRFAAFVASGAVVVSRFPPDEQRWQIAANGRSPRWSGDGRRLFYLAGKSMMEVTIDPGPPFRAAQPVELFTVTLPPAEQLDPLFDVDPRSDRFLMVQTAGRPPGLVVVRNWTRDLDG